MKIKFILSVLFFFMPGSLLLFGQDHGGTQFFNTPLYYNPAYTGLYEGFRVRFDTRNQGPAGETTFRSFHISGDVSARVFPGSGGIGVTFNSDNEGVGFIQNYDLGVSFSARVPLSGFILGQVGLKVAWLQKHMAWDNFKMSEKIIEKYGNIYDSGFIRADANVLNLPDFAIGGLVEILNSANSIAGTVGVSVDHLFEPDVSFIESEPAPLPRKWIAHADVIWAIKFQSKNKSVKENILKVNPAVVFQQQGALSSLMAGFNATKFSLYFGLWYKGEFGSHNSNSLALLGGYRYVFADKTGIKFTYSYDIPISGIPVTSGGAHEISIVIDFGKIKLSRKSDNYSIYTTGPKGFDARLSHIAF
jgi:type IX secretion system PorP/SprF family membrane protein